MRGRTFWLVAMTPALALLAGGCSSKCPKPIVYDPAALKEIQKAVEALPRDSILHQVMTDYENERDDLRFCR
ncbi:MAG TPA: hypothetical protein VEK82_02250 [Stellaceae bacterium]|nr:hypothetical protein [Stellaceae bacterium]